MSLYNQPPPNYSVCNFENIREETERRFQEYMATIYIKINGQISECIQRGIYKWTIFLNFGTTSYTQKKLIKANIKARYKSDQCKVKMYDSFFNKTKVTIKWY